MNTSTALAATLAFLYVVGLMTITFQNSLPHWCERGDYVVLNLCDR